MTKDDLVRVRHMLDSSMEAVCFTQNKSRQDLNSERQLVLSLVKLVEIIGEAASKVTKEYQLQSPQIPWQSIINMRNKLIHTKLQSNEYYL